MFSIISKTENELWDKANTLFKKSRYNESAKILMEIEDLYPASPRIKQVLFLASKSFFLGKIYIKAIETAELLKELDLQYSNDDVDEILIKSYYALLQRPERENKNLNLIINLSDKNPKKYNQIRQRCTDILAYDSLATGLMYSKKGNHLVALKYYGEIIKKYNTSNFTAEAYFRCAEIFHHLKLEKDANACIKILSMKHKKSIWYANVLKLSLNNTKSNAS